MYKPGKHWIVVLCTRILYHQYYQILQFVLRRVSITTYFSQTENVSVFLKKSI